VRSKSNLVELARICENCCHVFRPIGADCSMLACVTKEELEGYLCIVEPRGGCRGFKPKRVYVGENKEDSEGKDSRLIPLTQGRFAIVDGEDYDRLRRYKWRVYNGGQTCYAIRTEGQTTVRMHRQIMVAPKSLLVDHIDHNGLNNRRSNLRVCTNSQNQHNQRIRLGGRSKYKGVVWHHRDRCWVAQIRINGRRLYLGCFDNEVDGAIAYDRKAIELFGEFAHVNFRDLATKPPI